MKIDNFQSINCQKIRDIAHRVTHNKHESRTLLLIVQFRHISSMISTYPPRRGRGESYDVWKRTSVPIYRSTTIYAVLTVDAPAMHFYPALHRLPHREVGSIDIISGLCTTHAEFTMRFRVCTLQRTYHNNANAFRARVTRVSLMSLFLQAACFKIENRLIALSYHH